MTRRCIAGQVVNLFVVPALHLIGDHVDRHRQLEILCANAILKAVSPRYAPGTPERVLQFLADRGAVSGVVEQYHVSGDLEQACLSYWGALLEPDALRLEDLVSAILISFATSLAAGILLEGGKAAFPVLYRTLVKDKSIERTLADIAALESRRRGHLETLLELLNRKAAAVAGAHAAVQQELGQARSHLLAGETLDTFLETLSVPSAGVALTPVETVIRGALLTEEQRETGFRIDQSSQGETIEGMPLSSFFGVGQTVVARLPRIDAASPFGRAYDSIEEFVGDLDAPLRDAHKHAYLKNSLGRPPRKVVPVSDGDLRQLIDYPQAFMQCRPLLAGLVLRQGGMTCHTAVMSRGMGIPCIQLGDANFAKLAEYQFMALQEGQAQFFHAPPDQFHQFL
ncbi:hypothetical protein GCM10009087_30280 [Sphingomonas oligophenolica]|uniref:PEP-utilizing enzyme n=1 Tax=Sphingomonas oligophenolica TaxID=301154 RepID=A0ABU9Y6E9_9SPHN